MGMLVAHYTPWRAIKAGKDPSDSTRASAAFTTEAAIMCLKRAMLGGCVGPMDIFRNPQVLFRFF
jgi:2-methylcitrate dehydratase